MYIIFNGKLIKQDKQLIDVLGQGFNYGYGLFETIKLVDNKVHFLKEHIERLKKSCKEININYSLEYEKIQEYINILIEKCNIKNGSIKLVYTKEQNFIISSRENIYTKEKYEQGFKICFSSTIKNENSRLAYVKSMNYMENLLAKEEASKRGYDEAVLLNTNKYISEGTYTNIFFIKEDIIYTPDISCGILSGIMRNKIIDLAKNLNFNVVMGRFTKEDLQNSDEIFLTNSLMEIMPISKLEEKIFSLYNNKTTKYLRQKFYELY